MCGCVCVEKVLHANAYTYKPHPVFYNLCNDTIALILRTRLRALQKTKYCLFLNLATSGNYFLISSIIFCLPSGNSAYRCMAKSVERNCQQIHVNICVAHGQEEICGVLGAGRVLGRVSVHSVSFTRSFFCLVSSGSTSPHRQYHRVSK